MAVNSPGPGQRPPRPRRQRLFWSRLHFLIRCVGLTGVLVGCVGLLLATFNRELPTPDAITSWRDASVVWHDASTTVSDCFRTAFADPQEKWRTIALVCGAAAALFALLIEALAVLFFTAARRSAFGVNALIQGALAAALLVAINVWSFDHYHRFDITRGREFTLPDNVRKELAQLDPNSKTTVILYQRHKTFASPNDRPADDYESAAERKVVEKVKDLAEQFRAVGPQLQVEVLDVQAKDYKNHLTEVIDNAVREPRPADESKDAAKKREKREAERATALRQAIDSAPENSIFIQSGGHLRQMSFNELYQLDKVASQEANDGKGNLVLLAQGQGTSGRGVETFANKVLNLEERRPRIGVLVVHEYLTTEGAAGDFTLRALRTALAAHGFDVRDVVLKKGWEGNSPLEPAADTFEESKLERLDAELDDLDDEVKALKTIVKQLEDQIKDWALKPGEKISDNLDRLSKKHARELGGQRLTVKDRERALRFFEAQLAQSRQERDDKEKELNETRDERKTLNADRVLEAKRMSDVKAKLNGSLEECDLLFVPRLTRMGSGRMITNRIHRLSDLQVECIKEFMQAGKPVFACFGPTNEPPDFGLPPDTGRPDNLEALFGKLGIHFGKQTVLFNTDSKSFADRRRNPLRQADTADPPPLDFDTPPETAQGPWSSRLNANLPPNPLHEALRVTAHSVGKDFDLRLRFPRPIYFQSDSAFRLALHLEAFEPTFLLTAHGWNDDKPFVMGGRRPHYEQPKPDDPDKGKFDEKRRGAFPVGVAVKAQLPSSWYPRSADSVRVAVIGQGDVFVGPKLSPARERLFLQTANWLLGRDDYLPRADHPWSYPRVPLPADSHEHYLWLWGTRLGLPVLFGFLGFVVLLLRRLR
jgi:hypothetical protein